MITLETLPQATSQEVFDQVSNHLLKQNQKSLRKVPMGTYQNCLYFGPDELKCAAGCLIAPEEYKSEWEDNPWDDLVEQEEVPSDHCVLIRKLQIIHDKKETYQWKESLLILSKEMKLQFNSQL